MSNPLLKIPPEAYTAGVALVGVLVEAITKWLAASSGKTVEQVRADIRAELADTDADLATDRASEHDRFNAG